MSTPLVPPETRSLYCGGLTII